MQICVSFRIRVDTLSTQFLYRKSKPSKRSFKIVMATMRMTLAVHTFFGYLSSYCYTRILVIYCIALFYLLNCLTFFWLIYPRSELGLCCYLYVMKKIWINLIEKNVMNLPKSILNFHRPFNMLHNCLYKTQQ